MFLDDALKMLNYEPSEPLSADEIKEKCKVLFDSNSEEKGGSVYIQVKSKNRHERLKNYTAALIFFCVELFLIYFLLLLFLFFFFFFFFFLYCKKAKVYSAQTRLLEGLERGELIDIDLGTASDASPPKQADAAPQETPGAAKK